MDRKPAGAVNDNKFACLTYHHIGEGSSQYTLSESQLRSQLAFLHGEGYVVEGFEQLEARLRLGQGIPRRYVILTVDDGHESSMRAADLLETEGCRATFFLTRDRCLKRQGFIRSPHIRELRKRGFSLGTHGTTHRGLTFLSKDNCVKEIKESREWLEDVIGEQVRYMAAPGGFINSRVMNLAYERGYALVGTSKEWMNSPKTMARPCTVNRVNVRSHFSLKTFRHILEGHPGFYTWRQVRALSLWIPKQLLRPSSTKQVAPYPQKGFGSGPTG
jgi:peptidoglycan/xylan/chitin deacetylase (PgdA/CDA1 family)